MGITSVPGKLEGKYHTYAGIEEVRQFDCCTYDNTVVIHAHLSPISVKSEHAQQFRTAAVFTQVLDKCH